MKLRKSELALGAIVLLSLLIGVYFYSRMPEQMASHWNAQGQVDGYMSRFWGLFLMPLILVGLGFLFLVIPKIDPLRANIEQFRKYYDGFIILFFVFMLCVHFQVILWNLGIKISPNLVIPIGLGLLFFYVGILCENAKRNWFVGIRTPWTLSSDEVWEKTHRIGGKLFKVAGAIAISGALFPAYAVLFVLLPVLFVAVFTIIYSYFEYERRAG
jgi:uncharacterized membrane protein